MSTLFFQLYAPGVPEWKIAHIEWSKKAQNMGKSPKDKEFRGCWTVPPFWEHPVCINLNVQCRILLLWPQHGSGKITSKMHRHEIAILLYQKNACPLEQMGPMVKVLGILWRRDKDQDEKMQTSTKRSKKSQLYCGMRWRERSSKVRCFLFSFSILKQRNIREPVGNFRPPKGAKKTWSKMA